MFYVTSAGIPVSSCGCSSTQSRKEPPPQLASDESEDISPELEPVARLNPTFEREGITLTSVGDLDSYAAFGQGPFLSGSRSVAGPLAVLLLTSNRN
jgi:hypothetical protein